eukprot:CAMPEP_0206009498 /NCGR_PEP_ID=MMETSP1464-20131121/9821_1 /ASSEMBLY_ACC=CAM_ASM_001124 /TAXON_ID=119497 /ORGANISM="Exanthemachrysis gayraliae, Strain RCC1523" /LENGTH=399 /DNA_ID=CAMNT_0053383095 /DNA_START=211 /DNA_END=1408 /DNA_ORIENTATION=-
MHGDAVRAQIVDPTADRAHAKSRASLGRVAVVAVEGVQALVAGPARDAKLDALHLLVHEADVEDACVGEPAGVLDGQHPAVLVALVVVGVPPARRGDERAAARPVAAHGVDDVAVAVEAGAHERVAGARLGVHAEVQGDRVVAVRALHVLRGLVRENVQEAPERVRQRLGLRRRRGGEEDPDAVLVLGAGPVADSLHRAAHALAVEEDGLELWARRAHAEVLEEGLVGHPVEGRAAVGLSRRAGVHGGAVPGDGKEVPGGPVELASRRRGRARAADHVEDRRRAVGARLHALAHADAHVGGEEVRGGGTALDGHLSGGVEVVDRRGAALVGGCREAADGDSGMDGLAHDSYSLSWARARQSSLRGFLATGPQSPGSSAGRGAAQVGLASGGTSVEGGML